MPEALTSAEMTELKLAFKDALNYAADSATTPIDPLTYREPGGDGCLHIAAHRGDYRTVELLLKAGADANQVGEMGYTPLHYAHEKGHVAIVQLLLRHGAITTIKNSFGKLPLGT
jgi:ankyrin repeat protein